MGWRDVQAGVASGDISFKPEEDTFGSFMSGALGGAIKKRDKARADAIDAEKERKEKEKITLAETKAQAALETKWKNQSLHVMKSLGLQGGANSPDYLDIFTSISSGINQSDVLTGLTTQITDSRLTIGENGQFNKAATAVTAPSSYPNVADMHTLSNEDLQRLSQDPGAPEDVKAQAALLIKAVTDTPTSTDMSGWTVQRIKSARVNTTDPAVLAQMDALILEKDSQNTEQAGTDAATATSALYDDKAIMAASPETLVRMRSMAPPERQAAIDAAIAGLPPEKSAQAKYSTMSGDDLVVALALANESKDETAIKYLTVAITARGAIVSDKDLPKVENVRYDNFEAYALAARNAGDETLAVQIETLGEKQVAEEARRKGVKINAGAQSFIVAYVDKVTGETLSTTVTGTSEGKLYSHTLGRVVEQKSGTELVDIAAENKNYERVLKLQPMILPLEKKRKDLLATMTSAERLKDIVTKNPLVLTTVGSMAAGVNRIGVEMKALVDMSKTASTSSVMDYIDSQAKKSTGLGNIAEAAALYEAEVLKFAYSYAASGLGQSGQGLSNTDFEKALLIVGTGATEKTFLTNLHARVSDSIKATDVVITDFSTSAPVEILSLISGDLLKGYQQPVSTYATTHGFEGMYKWASKEYVADKTEVTPTGSTGGAPAGSMLITQAMADAAPGLAKYLGKTIYKENGKFVVWSK